MKALTYHGSKDVRVETVADPTLLAADDVILRVTATAICGSDLHLFHGKIPETKHGDIFGHEFMGVVEDAGADVTNVRVGDRVVIPFVIACGQCFFCENDLFAACETTNPDQKSLVRVLAEPPIGIEPMTYALRDSLDRVHHRPPPSGAQLMTHPRTVADAVDGGGLRLVLRLASAARQAVTTHGWL